MLTSTESILLNRRSVREFERQSLDTQDILQVLQSANQSVSSKNTQPWEVDLLSGQALNNLRSDYLQAFDQNRAIDPNYQYSMEPLPAEYKARAKELGISLFRHIEIARDDAQKLKQHYRANFAFFDAPHLILLSTRSDAERGNFLDCGAFLGCLLACIYARNWGACPSFSAVSWPDILLKHLPHRQNHSFICGVCLGIPKANSHVNSFASTRRPIEQWVKIYH